MMVRVKTPALRVRPQTCTRIRVVRLTDWDRIGRPHFLNRDAFDAVRQPVSSALPGWMGRLFGGR